MASGHASRINRPNTWLLRPDLRREESPCQHGAVHTWHIASRYHFAMTGMLTKQTKRASPRPRRRHVIGLDTGPHNALERLRTPELSNLSLSR